MIKFNNVYTKLPNGFEKSKVIQVLRVHKSQLSKQFIDYDTTAINGISYQLKDTTYILIFLLTNDNQLWTTLREWTPEKESKYRKMVGTIQECVIREEFEEGNKNYRLDDFNEKGKRVVSPF